MAKDPAFLFYPNDYIGGTMGMTFEEKGAYIELLMVQFNRGHMTKDMIEHTLGHKFAQLFGRIEDKFLVDSNGLYYNERLEKEKIARQNYTNSRRNNVLGSNQHTKNKIKKHGHMSNHMEDENEDYIRVLKNKKGIKFSEDFKKVIFEDDEQNLTIPQQCLAKNGDINANELSKFDFIKKVR